MTEPKAEIKSILDEISGAVSYQSKPRLLKVFPALIFYIAENTPSYVLEKDVAYQSIQVVIDIYAKTSKESGALLIALESKMLENGYRLTLSQDVPNDDFSHITTRFNISN